MKHPDELNLEIVSDPHQLPDVRECMREWCQERGWNEDQIAEIILAADEALTNVIRHGYGSVPGQPIHIRVRKAQHTVLGEGLEIAIRDFGKQVALDTICGRDLDKPRPGGLGVHIIRAMMDSADYSHAAGGGIRLVMCKFKGSKKRPQDAAAGTE